MLWKQRVRGIDLTGYVLNLQGVTRSSCLRTSGPKVPVWVGLADDRLSTALPGMMNVHECVERASYRYSLWCV
jgi:hypothetical protein